MRLAVLELQVVPTPYFLSTSGLPSFPPNSTQNPTAPKEREGSNPPFRTIVGFACGGFLAIPAKPSWADRDTLCRFRLL